MFSLPMKVNTVGFILAQQHPIQRASTNVRQSVVLDNTPSQTRSSIGRLLYGNFDIELFNSRGC
jgi:hypothetical protein